MDRRHKKEFTNIDEIWDEKLRELGIDILDDTINDHTNK